MWVQPLGWEDPLEEGMVMNSSILAWRIPWIEEPGGYSSNGHKESDMTLVTAHTLHFAFLYYRKGFFPYTS